MVKDRYHVMLLLLTAAIGYVDETGCCDILQGTFTGDVANLSGNYTKRTVRDYANYTVHDAYFKGDLSFRQEFRPIEGIYEHFFVQDNYILESAQNSDTPVCIENKGSLSVTKTDRLRSLREETLQFNCEVESDSGCCSEVSLVSNSFPDLNGTYRRIVCDTLVRYVNDDLNFTIFHSTVNTQTGGKIFDEDCNVIFFSHEIKYIFDSRESGDTFPNALDHDICIENNVYRGVWAENKTQVLGSATFSCCNSCSAEPTAAPTSSMPSMAPTSGAPTIDYFRVYTQSNGTTGTIEESDGSVTDVTLEFPFVNVKSTFDMTIQSSTIFDENGFSGAFPSLDQIGLFYYQSNNVSSMVGAFPKVHTIYTRLQISYNYGLVTLGNAFPKVTEIYDEAGPWKDDTQFRIENNANLETLGTSFASLKKIHGKLRFYNNPKLNNYSALLNLDCHNGIHANDAASNCPNCPPELLNKPLCSELTDSPTRPPTLYIPPTLPPSSPTSPPPTLTSPPSSPTSPPPTLTSPPSIPTSPPPTLTFPPSIPITPFTTPNPTPGITLPPTTARVPVVIRNLTVIGTTSTEKNIGPVDVEFNEFYGLGTLFSEAEQVSDVSISNNKNLTSFEEAFASVPVLEAGDEGIALRIENNPSLVTFGNSFASLTKINGKVLIRGNEALTDFSALSDVTCHNGIHEDDPEKNCQGCPDEFINLPHCNQESPSRTSHTTLWLGVSIGIFSVFFGISAIIATYF